MLLLFFFIFLLLLCSQTVCRIAEEKLIVPSSLVFVGRIAVVTGANKGIGLGICRQLAADGVVVVVTSRDKKRGLDAVRELEDAGLSDFVVFHQLDVTDPSSVASLAKFIGTRFGKLDILVSSQAFLVCYVCTLGGCDAV